MERMMIREGCIYNYRIEIREGIKGEEKQSDWGGGEWVSMRPGGWVPPITHRKIKKLTIKGEEGEGGWSQLKDGEAPFPN